MKERFQILSLDGGGIKGLFSAAVLAKLEEDLNIKITNHFNLITGTSTGGIISLGLGLGLSPKEIVDFYVNKGKSIFPKKYFENLQHFLRRKYSSKELKKSLIECFTDKLLGASNKRLVIPAYSLDSDDVHIFKTAHHERFTRDYKVEMWKVAMATSAAPTYFSCFQEVDSIRLADGGVWANNPIMVGIVEAIGVLNIPLEAIKVLSLGTTDEVTSRPNRLNNGGLWHWRKQGIKVALRGQSISANNQAFHLLGEDNLLRIDPKVPDNLFALDKLSSDKLLSFASTYSREFSPKFKQVFVTHIAKEFIPFHKSIGGK